MDIQEVRDLFPYIKTGRIYFNHASSAPLSIRVLDKINLVLKNSSEGKIDDYLSFLSVAGETKKLFADYLNTTPDTIAFGDNTTNGINLLAQGLDWRKGDRIILNDIEFPANVYPYLNLQQYGVEIDFLKSREGIVSADDIISNVKPGTRLISISQVQFLTGYRIDLQKLGSFCRSNDIILAVDAIQGLGAFPIDVEREQVDFISSGTQKWMLGLQGMAFIYISKALIEKLKPKYVGWLSVEHAWDLLNFDLVLRNNAERYQTGTVNTIGIYAVNAALKLFFDFGITEISKRVTAHSVKLIKMLCEIGIDPFLQNCTPSNLSGIVSFKINDAQKVFDKLSDNMITVALREGIIRLSPHFYNDDEDIDKVISALKSAL